MDLNREPSRVLTPIEATAPSARRRRRPAARPGCEALEGRALRAAMPGTLDAPAVDAAAQASSRPDGLATGQAELRATRGNRPDGRVGPIARPGFARRGPSARPGGVGGGAKVIRNVVYRTEGDRPERLDVYLPAGPTPEGGWPVVLAIHGGGWRRFSKEQYGPKVAPLTASGFAVVVPNYTLSAPGRSSWPEVLEDVREAVRWARRNAGALGFDPDRVAAIGESSGGHLAAMLGTDRESGSAASEAVSSRVDAVVDFYGPADLAALVYDSGGGPAAVQLLGGRPESMPGRFAAASPAVLASPGDAPTLLIHGTADPVVSTRQSQLLASAMTRAGVPNRLVILPGAGHGFGPFDSGGSLTGEVIGFLRAHA